MAFKFFHKINFFITSQIKYVEKFLIKSNTLIYKKITFCINYEINLKSIYFMYWLVLHPLMKST